MDRETKLQQARRIAVEANHRIENHITDCSMCDDGRVGPTTGPNHCGTFELLCDQAMAAEERMDALRYAEWKEVN